jgi:hypothetical protein
MQVERHEIDDAHARDSQPAAAFHHNCRSGVLRHDLTRNNRHFPSFQHTPAKLARFFNMVANLSSASMFDNTRN